MDYHRARINLKKAIKEADVADAVDIWNGLDVASKNEFVQWVVTGEQDIDDALRDFLDYVEERQKALWEQEDAENQRTDRELREDKARYRSDYTIDRITG